MAIYHLYIKTLSRNKGTSIVESAAYRSGERLYDNYYGKSHDYTRKHGVVYAEVLLPLNAPVEFYDRTTLWNAVEIVEKRIDSRLAREVEFALPIELPLKEQINLAKEYVMDNFVSKGMCADLTIHDKGNCNPHAHILLTTRSIDCKGFSKKNRDWDKKINVTIWREQWAKILNRELEHNGFGIIVSHESYDIQKPNLIPTMHLGPRVIFIEMKGTQTDKGNKNRAIKKLNMEYEERAHQRQLMRDQEQMWVFF